MSKKSILIVDDESEHLENLLDSLEDLVDEIHTAQNGSESLNIIENNDVDVVLTDIKMPVMDGLEFAKKAREMGFNKPIVFLSAHGDDDLRKKALSYSVFDFIDKPYNEADLQSIIKRALDESSGDSSQSKDSLECEGKGSGKIANQLK